MQTIKSVLMFLVVASLLSCHRDKPVSYRNRVAEDLNYRIGKWYSVSNDTIHFSKLDTIWFINDTLAGWTGFVPDHPNQYVFRKTYFVNPYYLYRLFPNVDDSTITDTIKQQCAMNARQDTLGLYWDNFDELLLEQYVKKTD